MAPEMAHFQNKLGCVFNYFDPVISITCEHFKSQGQFEGKVQ